VEVAANAYAICLSHAAAIAAVAAAAAAAAAAAQVADQVMWQAASYPTSVEPLAEVLKLPNPLTMDVLTYMVGL
jgi:hypothetical protein